MTRAASRPAPATPTRRATSSATASGLLRGLRRGRADGAPPSDVVDHPLAPLEDADPLPRAPLPGGHLRRARQRQSDRPRGEAYDEREFAADAIAVMDATETERAVIVGFSMGGQRGLILAAEHPERVAGAAFIGPSFPGGGEPLPERWNTTSTRSTKVRGLGEVQPHYWLPRLPRLRRVLHVAGSSRSPTRPSRSKTRRLGARDRRPRR